MRYSIHRAILADYGEDVATATGAARYMRRPHPRPRLISSRAGYVEACRQLDAREPHLAGALAGRIARVEGRIDGRLVADGFTVRSPRAWLAGELTAYLAWYERAAGRPDRPGSPYNTGAIVKAWAAHVPAWIARAVGARACAARRHAPSGAPILGPRRRARLVLMARAMSRTSAGWVLERDGHPRGRPLADGAWAALGRLSPEVQRAILIAVARESREAVRNRAPLHVRDLPWGEARRAAGEMARSERARIAWAAGRRQRELLGDRYLGDVLADPRTPNGSDWVLIALARGARPSDLAHGADAGVMSDADACLWLRSGGGPYWSGTPTHVSAALVEAEACPDASARAPTRWLTYIRAVWQCAWRTAAQERAEAYAAARSCWRSSHARAWACAINAARSRWRRSRHERRRARMSGRVIWGWRAWRVDAGCLYSPSQGTPWPTRDLRAHVWSRDDAVRGQAGIHACWSRVDAAGQGCSGPEAVLGRVLVTPGAAWVAGPEGWRAEAVEIDRLVVSADSEPALIAALRVRYGVPVTMEVRHAHLD